MEGSIHRILGLFGFCLCRCCRCPSGWLKWEDNNKAKVRPQKKTEYICLSSSSLFFFWPTDSLIGWLTPVLLVVLGSAKKSALQLLSCGPAAEQHQVKYDRPTVCTERRQRLIGLCSSAAKLTVAVCRCPLSPLLQWINASSPQFENKGALFKIQIWISDDRQMANLVFSTLSRLHHPALLCLSWHAGEWLFFPCFVQPMQQKTRGRSSQKPTKERKTCWSMIHW